jgi:hypothetical protein
MEDTLFGSLEHEGVGLTRAEAKVLRSLLDDPSDSRMQSFEHLTSEPELLYSFSKAGISETVDEFAVAAARMHPDTRRVLRAWRQPSSDSAPCPPAWVYVIETTPESYIPHVRLTIAGEFIIAYQNTYPLEVLNQAEELPAYQETALAAAQRIWASS